MHRLSAVVGPERFTALHGEEKREEGVRGDPNEISIRQGREGQGLGERLAVALWE